MFAASRWYCQLPESEASPQHEVFFFLGRPILHDLRAVRRIKAATVRLAKYYEMTQTFPGHLLSQLLGRMDVTQHIKPP